MAANGAPDYTWLSLAQAEAVAGVSRSTLRAWFRAGDVPSRLAPGPHGPQREVPLETVLDKVRRSPRLLPDPDAPERPRPPPANARETGAAGGDVAAAAVRLAEMAIEVADRRAHEAERRAVAAELALRDALQRAAAAEAELAVLRRR